MVMTSKRKYPFREVAEPDMAPHLQAAIDLCPMNPDDGKYTTLIYSGIEDKDRAILIRRNLYNAARRMQYSLASNIELVPGQDGQPDTWKVTFTPIDKATARAYVVKKYGTDRSNWPYQPGRKKATLEGQQ
jgi:hypothetical protein